MTTERASSVVVATAQAITHRYRSRSALDDVSFDLRPGITGLVGANGAGKSTLLNILAGAMSPKAGTFRVAGIPDAARREHRARLRRSVALVPQTFVPPAWLRTNEFLHYMAWMRAVPSSRRSAAVDAALDATDLADRRRDRLDSLSGGMLRRVLIAQALVAQPLLILLDEPTAGLDPEQRIRIRELVRARSAEAAVIFSSHLMEDVVGLADRVIVLDEGSVVFDGSVDELAAVGQGVAAHEHSLSPHEAAFVVLRRRPADDR